MKLLPSLLLIVGGVAAAVAAAPAPPAPTGLMCELLAMPERVRITDPRPELTWIVGGAGRDELQTAYQVRVATSRAGLESGKDLPWDSGKVRSDRSVAVEYGGQPLRSDQEYWWAVRTWNREGKSSPWSTPQRFLTGTLAAGPAAAGAGPDARITAVRYPVVQTEVAPVKVTALEGGRTFLDFGRAAFAGLKVTITGAQGGETVVVHLGEALEAPNRVHRKPGGSIRYHRAELKLEPGTRTYTVPLTAKDARRMPPEIGPVMPYRYVEVEGSPSPLTAGSARQVVAHYPFDDQAASFSCSDPKLNAIWELCRYSMKATSTFGVYVDGDRERLPYEADAYINQLGHYCSDREFSLARYSHEYLMVHPTWPTEWILHSPLMAWEDYVATGDRESLLAFYEDLKAKTLRSLAREDGLITTAQPPVSREVLRSVYSTRMQDIVDWPMAERDGYQMRPVNTVVNVFHYGALDRLARIAAALDQKTDERDYRAAADRVSRAINEKLFDAKTGLYVDGEGGTHSSLHANMFPLAFGIVPAERRSRVVEFVRSKGMACSVYAAQYLMEALYDTGQAEYARALMTAPGDRSWRHMVEDVGTTIALEAWDNKYKPNQDWNHAWGAAPANIIPRKLMGVEPLEPGYRRIRIRPQPGGLEWAKLTLPTVRGPVQADFQSSPTRFALNLNLPANTRADVYLPQPSTSSSKLTVNGKLRKVRRDGEFLVVEGVGSGPQTLVVDASEARR